MFKISHLNRKTNVELFEMAKVKLTLLRKHFTREETAIFWTLDIRKGKTKTTD